MGTRSAADSEKYVYLRLFVLDGTAKSLNAIGNLKKICKEQLRSKCRIEIVDIARHPEAAIRDQIVAVPTLLRKIPKSMAQAKRIIGDLSDSSRVLAALKL